jgi:hypothetical protein
MKESERTAKTLNPNAESSFEGLVRGLESDVLRSPLWLLGLLMSVGAAIYTGIRWQYGLPALLFPIFE